MPFQNDIYVLAYLSIWLGILGAVLGSFLDCAVSRWAVGEPPFRGRSHCVSCGRLLSASDLIPVFSWLFRRGRCRYCGRPIPAHCLAAELAGAGVFVLLGRTVPPVRLGQWLVWAALLLALSLTDCFRRLIPDKLLLALAANRLVWFFVLREGLGTLFNVFLSLLIPAALLALILLGERLTGRELMGGGDLKLLFVQALYLTWAQQLLALLTGCVLGLIWAALSGQKRGAAVAFGPFLALGAVLTVALGDGLIHWYLGLF